MSHTHKPATEAHLRAAIGEMAAELSKLIKDGYTQSDRAAWLREQLATLGRMVG